MKKTTIILISFMSVFLGVQAQTLHTDEKGVLVFCEIQQTNKTTLCKGGTNSTKKINIWKVTLGIKNGYSESIVPRGVGIADISVYPDPIKPYSYEYCSYDYVKNYEPNSAQRHLDQSLYVWPILGYKVEEIKPGMVITNTTYLYLYEGQQPKLTNWEFLGYRLKDDFDAIGDPILIDMKADSTTVASKVTVIRNDKLKEKDAIVVAPKDLGSIKIVSVDAINVNPISSSIDEDNNPTEKVVIEEKPLVEENKINEQIVVEEMATDVIEVTNSTVDDENLIKTTIASDSITNKEPVSITSVNNEEHVKVVGNCPGEKSLEYRKMSDVASDSEEQKAYSWLALYYSYVCECESGSQDADQLVAVINNVVDSFISNTKGEYGEIPKVTKCKTPVEK